MESYEINRMIDYWQGKCQDGKLPSKDDIDPVDIPELLPWIGLVEVRQMEDASDFRLRLQGTGIVSAFGRDISGQWASEIYPDWRLSDIREAYGQVIRSRQPEIMEYRTFRRDQEIVYRKVILPLATDGVTIDRFVVMYDFPDETRAWVDPMEPGVSTPVEGRHVS